MRIRSILSCCALAATLLSVSACDRETTLPADSLDGRVSFSYAGDESGHFLAESDNVAHGDPANLYVASAYPYFNDRIGEYPAAITVYGAMRLANGSYHFLSLAVPRQEASQTCRADKKSTCGAGAFVELNKPDFYSKGEGFYPLSITTNLTELTDRRARGTFSMTVGNGVTNRTLKVVSGKFDVPVIRGF